MTSNSDVISNARLSVTEKEFNGSVSSAIVLDHDAAYEIPRGTIEMLVTPDKITGGYQTLFSKDSSGYDDGGHLMITMDGDGITVRQQATNNQTTLNATDIFEAGEQTHITVTFGAEGLHVYADGEEVAADPSFKLGLVHNKEPIVLGGNQYKSGDLVADNIQHVFGGTINHVNMVAGELSAEQIKTLATAALGNSQTPQEEQTDPEVADQPERPDVPSTGGADDLKVTSVTGSFENGSTIVIDGMNFGDLGPNVIVYDSFANNVDKEGDVGSWARATKDHSTVDGYSGDGAVVADINKQVLIAGVADEDGAFGLEQFTEVFVGVAIKDIDGRMPAAAAPGEFADISSSKDVWLMMGQRGDNAVYSAERGTPNGHDVYIPGHTGEGSYSIHGNNTQTTGWWPSVNWDHDGWNHQTFYARLNEDDIYGDVEQAYFQAVSEYGLKTSEYSGPLMSPIDNVPETWDRLKFGNWYAEYSGQRLMDDAYVATGEGAQARIVVTNSPVYEQSTAIAYLVPTEWSDGQVTATFYGAPMDLGNAYIHVFDAEGNRSDSGVKINPSDAAVETVTDNTPILDDTFEDNGNDQEAVEHEYNSDEFNEVLSLNSAVFDGTPGSVIVLDHESAFEHASGTLEIQVTPDQITSGRQTLVSKDSSGYDDGGHLMVTMEGDALHIRLQGVSNQAKITVQDVFKAGEQTNLAITFGDEGLHVYADGKEVASDALWTNGLQGNLEPVVIGANQYASSDLAADNLVDFFDGVISKVTLSDGQMSAEQIADRAISDSGMFATSDSFAYNMAELRIEDAEAGQSLDGYSVEEIAGYTGNQDALFVSDVELNLADDASQDTPITDDIFIA